MARYDKYDPISGGFRAPLNADLVATEDTGAGNPIGVTVNTSGRVVAPAAGNGTSGVVGVLCTTKNLKAGDVVDVMSHGEIVEIAGLTAGDEITVAAATGILGTGAVGAGVHRVGHTVEATRLIVRMNGSAA